MPIDPSRPLAELVLERPSRARVLERFGLDYCCGGKRSLAEACEHRDLEPETVAAELEAAALRPDAERDWGRAPLAELAEHIVRDHHGLLRRELPRLGALLEKVERAHGAELPELAELRETFAAMRAELEEHMADEEADVFPSFRDGGPFDPAEIAELEAEHAATGAALERLRELTGGYDLKRARCNTHRATIDGLRELELDLHRHIHEENNILFPRVFAAA